MHYSSWIRLTTPGVALAGLVLTGTPALAASASSSAYDASANLTASGAGPFTLGPINPVGGAAPPAYNLSNSVVSYSFSTNLSGVGLPLDTLDVTAGILNASASSSYPSPPSATAAASITNLDVTLTDNSGPLPITLLSLMAQTIDSTATATSGSASGTANLVGVTLTGSLITGSITIPTNPTPNDVIYNLGGLEVVLNEQAPIGSNGISVNAVDIIFNQFPLGLNALNGNVILAHSQAQAPSVSAVPEPASWALMITSAGLMGAVFRRRRFAVRPTA